MNAAALNPASTLPAGSVGSPGTAAGSKTGGVPAGFGSLLDALFPQGAAPETTPIASTPVASTPDNAKVDDALGVALEDQTVDFAEVNAQPLSSDASVALLASLFSGQPPTTENIGAKQSAENGHAFGRDKGQGVPAAPALLNANPKAGLLEKAGLEGETLVDLAATNERAELRTNNPRRADLLTPPPVAAPGPRSAAPPPPSPLASDLPDVIGATPVVATADPSEPQIIPPSAAATAPNTVASTPPPAGLVARQEPAPATRSARAERNRSSTETRPADEIPAGQGAPATGVTGAVKPAAGADRVADAGSEAANAATRDADVAADAPDATAQAETRTATQSLTPLTQGAQAVRGSPETVATLAAQIIKKLEGQSTRFDVELNPAGLGKVDVRIDIGAHGRISAAMMFDNPAAAADLRARASELQRMLEQAGFDMSGGISFDVAGDRGQQQRQAWQDPHDNSGQAFRGQAFRAALDTAGNATDAAIEGALRLRRGVNAGLDLRI